MVLPGTPVVTSLGAYPTFNFHVAGNGGRLVTVPYRNDREDLEALLETLKHEEAPMVFLANPDNPLGSWHSAANLEAFSPALPEATLLVLDEAYIETAPTDAASPVGAMIDLPNVLRMRTFSKAYGLAGPALRLCAGQAWHHRLVRQGAQSFRRQSDRPDRRPSRPSGPGLSWRSAAGSTHRASALPLSGETTGLTRCLRPPISWRSTAAAVLMRELGERGVFVRMPGVAPLNRCIRISCGPAEALDIFEQELHGALKAVG